MPKISKATKRDNKRFKQRYGVSTDGRGYMHILNRKNNDREELLKGK